MGGGGNEKEETMIRIKLAESKKFNKINEVRKNREWKHLREGGKKGGEGWIKLIEKDWGGTPGWDPKRIGRGSRGKKKKKTESVGSGMGVKTGPYISKTRDGRNGENRGPRKWQETCMANLEHY